MDGDGNGWQLEKVGPTFSSSSICVLGKSLQTSYGLLFLREFT